MFIPFHLIVAIVAMLGVVTAGASSLHSSIVESTKIEATKDGRKEGVEIEGKRRDALAVAAKAKADAEEAAAAKARAEAVAAERAKQEATLADWKRYAGELEAAWKAEKATKAKAQRTIPHSVVRILNK